MDEYGGGNEQVRDETSLRLSKMESDTYDNTATMPQDATAIDGNDSEAIANE